MTEITGPGVQEMRLLSVKAHQADRKLKAQMRARLKEVAQPIEERAQMAILRAGNFSTVFSSRTAGFGRRAGEGRGRTWHKHGSLRVQIAHTITASVSIRANEVTLDVVSAGRKMPAGKENLNAHTDAERGWGHPVFARAGFAGPMAGLPGVAGETLHRRSWTWVREFGEPHWFENTIGRSAKDAEDALRQAMQDVKHWLE